VHRPKQKKTVMIYELGMEDTIERRIYKILEEKKALAGEVIDGLAEEDIHLNITIDE
jgi:SNF2 family DNA or RNA helicase